MKGFGQLSEKFGDVLDAEKNEGEAVPHLVCSGTRPRVLIAVLFD